MNELWVSVEEFPNYDVSSLGRFRRSKGGKGAKAGRVLSWHMNTSNGYAQIRFMHQGVQHARSVHAVVAHAFLGEKPIGICVRHLDGNKLNNKLSNLALGTYKQNSQDMVRHGRSTYGDRNCKAKLTDQLVVEIRTKLAGGVSTKAIAADMGLHESTIYRIKSGARWAHVLGSSNRAQDKTTS